MSFGFERIFLLSYCLACCWPGLGANLHIIRQWKEVEFVFPSEEAKQTAIEQHYYVPGNSVPIDVDVDHRKGDLKSRIFVTFPRFDEGRPVTLGTVDDQGRIAGYPDYSWHDKQGYNCEGITSVFRVAIDECKRLWVMDTGKIGDIQHCSPQILAFDLKNDNLIYRHVISNSSYSPVSLFITPVVDVRSTTPGSCEDTFVYVADVTGYGILVIDVVRDQSWRVTHKFMYPYPSRGTFYIDGETFDLMDGILGMALSPYHPGEERYLYFHALASTTENVVRTDVLRNSSNIENPSLNTHAVTEFSGQRSNQSAAEAMDSNGILIFGLMEPPSIWCWNSATKFAPHNFHKLAFDRKTLQFASGLKIVNNLKGEQELWVLTSSFQRVMTGSLTSDVVNYRIHAEKTSVLLKNSPCLMPPMNQRPDYYINTISKTINNYRDVNKYSFRSYL